MTLRPTVPRPDTPGLFVHRNACEQQGNRLMIDGVAVTGTVAQPEIDESIDDFERVRLDSYVDGELAGPFVDELLGIDTSVCVVFTDDHYAVEMDPRATSMIELNYPAQTVSLLAAIGGDHTRWFKFWPGGSLAGLDGIEAEARDGKVVHCSWNWDSNGSMTMARCSYGMSVASGDAANSAATFSTTGELEFLSISGDFLNTIAPVAMPEDSWVLQSIEELLQLEVGASIRVPDALEIEDELIEAAPTWLAGVRHLDMRGILPVDFALRLIDTCNFSSICIDSLGGRQTWQRSVAGDASRLLELARSFVASGNGRTAEIDHCLVGPINANFDSIVGSEFIGSIVFDEQMEHLVGLDAPFLREEYVDLMAASPVLEYVRINAGSREKNEHLLAPMIELHPNATFLNMEGRMRNSRDSFGLWLAERRGR